MPKAKLRVSTSADVTHYDEMLTPMQNLSQALNLLFGNSNQILERQLKKSQFETVDLDYRQRCQDFTSNRSDRR